MSAPLARVRVLRRRVERTRDDLDRLVSELQRRRREAMDLKVQARRHPIAVTALALGAAGLVAGGTLAAVRAARRARVQRTRSTATRLAAALAGLDGVGRPTGRVEIPASPLALLGRLAVLFAPAVGALVARRVAGRVAGLRPRVF